MKFVFLFSTVLLLLGAGCQRSPVILSQSDGPVEYHSYLEANIEKANFGGKMFCTYAEIPEEESDGLSPYNGYWWVVCQEYYQSEGALLQGTGVSFPVVVTIDDTTGNISHLDYPSDANYVADIERLFPKSMAKRILKPGYVLTPNLRSEAESYFAEQPQK